MNRILSCREWNSNSLGTNERNESAIETGFAIPSGGGVSLIRIGTKEMSGRVLLRLVKNFRESLRPKCFFFSSLIGQATGGGKEGQGRET